jgi:hypothetical protein
MKRILWGLFFVLTTATALLVSQGFWRLNPAFIVALGIFYSLQPLGALWMIYQCVRYERRPFPLLLVALVPYSFVWYYFERVKKGKQTFHNTATG